MTKYSSLILDSPESLRNNTVAWNLLWERSNVTSPLLRAECIEHWMNHFAAGAAFHTLVIESDGNFVAGIPLFRGNKVKPLRTGMLTSNDWAFCGDLLLDNSVDAGTVFDCLFATLKSLPYDLLWIDPVRFDHPQWKLFREYLQETKRQSQWLPRYQTAVVPLKGERESVTNLWKKNEIKHIRRRIRNNLSNSCELKVFDNTEQIESLLPECFQLEDSGWKGAEGGSILKQNKGTFFLEQARLLAEQGFLRLYILFYAGKQIAFQYCYRSKKTVLGQKVGIDDSLRQASPGQVLHLMINEQLIDDSEIDYFDFMGIMAPNQEIWNPEPQTVGQIVLPISFLGKTFFSLYDTVMPYIRRRRESKQKKTEKE
ncbi:MAG: GNAT family N-acetyltransferase [Planctomycetaceae bacterium]|jgi:CelD/BcsL family acetyltransferase involved in cellulose biosynthesis|nr:GNAT family N-acetyltransferase [Planctomycetaceae bacterium]